MNIIETIIAAIAPHTCEGCGAEGALLCSKCRTLLEPSIERCYRCHKVSLGGKTCKSCRSSSKVARVKAATNYNGPAKQLVRRLKFQRARAGGEEIGVLPTPLAKDLQDDVIVVHVPTATSRVRRRGYDQSAVIARQLAKNTNLRYAPLLSRQGQHKQVGATGAQRRKRMDRAFRVRRPQVATGARIILIDDVITTGATLEAAAKTLREAGAKTVEAIVFARA